MKDPGVVLIFAGVLAWLCMGLLPTQVSAQEEGTPPVSAKSTQVKVVSLQISPVGPTVPALHYRLLPRASDRTPGDAAPIYIRLCAYHYPKDARASVQEKTLEWLQTPLDQFPIAGARGLINPYSNKLKQLEYGSRRRSCDWNYTQSEESDHIFEILLPDAQEMRGWGQLLALKARIEIAEGNLTDAARTIETGLAFARHVAEGPYFVNTLIGMNIATMMLDRVDDWVGRAGSPSLYWSMTALPSPLVSGRDAMDQEQKSLDLLIPELDDIQRPRTEAEWSLLLGRLQTRMAYAQQIAEEGEASKMPYAWKNADLAWLKANLLPEARAGVQATYGSTDGMTNDQIIVLFVAGRYREFRDDLFKPAFLPVADASPFYVEAGKQLRALKSGPLGVFAAMAPNVAGVQATSNRLDRRVAILRAVEAIRLQAHADGGKLPDSLAKATVVPVPLDPITAKPFDFRRDGDSIVLTGPSIRKEGGGPYTEITYQLRLRP